MEFIQADEFDNGSKLQLTPGMGVMSVLKARGFTLQQWEEMEEWHRQTELEYHYREQQHLEARRKDEERKRMQRNAGKIRR